ncbi:MAG: hypothetical protein NC311_08890 [Muribaculaceae bacterium]|nr:hypothetical protein [Muribaculaceae bacterium]
MKMTVNEIRVRLFGLIDPVINTPEFHEKHHLVSNCSMEEALEISAQNFNLTMAYINAIATHLDVKDFAATANRSVPSEVIYTAYFIYWHVTQTLVRMDQRKIIAVPDSNGDFLMYMFQSFLGDFIGESG